MAKLRGVLRPDIHEPELNPVYAAMLRHYDVVADPCRVGDPDRKGTVENAIQHTQGTALKGRRYAAIEEQNAGLVQVAGSYYAALPARLHSVVQVRIYAHEIEILDAAGVVLRQHATSQRKGQFVAIAEYRSF